MKNVARARSYIAIDLCHEAALGETGGVASSARVRNSARTDATDAANHPLTELMTCSWTYGEAPDSSPRSWFGAVRFLTKPAMTFDSRFREAVHSWANLFRMLPRVLSSSRIGRSMRPNRYAQSQTREYPMSLMTSRMRFPFRSFMTADSRRCTSWSSSIAPASTTAPRSDGVLLISAMASETASLSTHCVQSDSLCMRRV